DLDLSQAARAHQALAQALGTARARARCAWGADRDVQCVYGHLEGIGNAKPPLTDHRRRLSPHNEHPPAFWPACRIKHMAGRNSAVWVILAVFAAAVGVAAFNQGDGEEIIPWRTSLDDARDEASADGKLVLAYFTADWCQPCQVMKRTTWANPDVEQKLR